MALFQTSVHNNNIMLILLLTFLTIIDLPSRAEGQGEDLVLAEGATHTLSCSTPSGGTYTIGWVTNNGHLPDGFTQEAEEILDYGMLRRNVTVTAIPNVNNTALSCVVTDVVMHDISNPFSVTIIIQGKLQLPVVQYTMEEQRVQFSWYPPFSYDITNVEPDITHYEVNVTNVVDHTVTTNITNDTSFLLESTYCQLHAYIVEIAAVNVVGVGEKYTSPPITLDELHLSIIPTVSLSGEDPEIMLQVNTSCKEIKLSITFICITSPKQLTINRTIIDSEDTTLSSVDIELNEHYQIIIGVEGSPTFNHTLYLRTFDVKSVNIEIQSNEYKFRCYFATGSRARGCTIVLRHEVNGECELIAFRSEIDGEAVAMATLANGRYSVMVYDIEEVESEGQGNPAYTTNLVVVDSVDSKATVCLGQLAPNNDTADDIMTKGSNTAAIATGICVPLVLIVLALVVGLGTFSLKKRNGPRKFQEEKGVTTEEHEYVPSPRAQEQLTQTNDSDMTQQDAVRDSLPSENRNMTEDNIAPPTESQQREHTLFQSQEENSQFTPSEINNAATLPQPFTAPEHPSSAVPSFLQPQNSDSSSTETSPPPSATSTAPLLPPKPPAVVARQTHYADVEVKPRDKRLQSPPRTNDQNVLYSIIALKTTSP